MASQGNTRSAKALLEQGKKAVAAMRDGSADALDLIEAYVDAFAKWEATWKVSQSGSKEVPPDDRELAKRVANQHAQVLRLTGEMQAKFVESLRGLRAKGRGLKKYIDQLPQKMSTIDRKG